MNRTDAYFQMMEASAVFQHNIALILEAKAREAEKSGNWIANHLHPESFAEHDKLVEHTSDMHDQIIELIDGLTKMENSLTSCMKAVLGQVEESSGSGGGFDFSNSLLNWGGDDS